MGQVMSTFGSTSDTLSPPLLLVERVMHERLRPAHNRFVYPVFCVRLNLDRLKDLDRWWFGVDRRCLMGIRTRDYGACDGSDLAAWMRRHLAEAGVQADGEIWLQTFPRVFGYVFNPVSFWYCHDSAGGLRALLAEVTSTFGERHSYLLTGPEGQAITSSTTLECRKQLHVSPFCRVEGRYQFRVRDTADTSFVGIDYFDSAGLVLRTSIGGRKSVLNRQSATQALMRQPFMTFSIIARIYWQAVRLWLANVPFFPKPQVSNAASPTVTSENAITEKKP
ncbi:DUF1365 domain-containing protein [Paralcaligenes sp. KSB-10]|uniref:DUF1365 domain-containing protein n=1 Tax=Paralcaligenes sp. KSB-10 TaxID=2901142 RepID=UPI0021021267|nr:DUF1365 domain-containing protein [Paralcaligenes sp. KSB-10]